MGQGDRNSRGDTIESLISKLPAIDFGTGSLKVESIYSGSNHNCAIFVDSSMRCFGRNDFGQLAIGSNQNIGDKSNEMGKNLSIAQISALNTPAPTSLNIQCDYVDDKTCNQNRRCIWKIINGINKCIVYDCAALSNETKCEKQKSICKWDKKSKLCSFKE